MRLFILLITTLVLGSVNVHAATKKEVSDFSRLDKKVSLQADLIRKLKRENAILKKAINGTKKTTVSNKEEQVNQAIAFSEKVLFNRFQESFARGEKANYRKALKLLAKNYPNSSYFADVYFIAGRSALAKGKYKTALRSFNKVLVKYPKSQKVPSVLYSKAYTYQEMKLSKNALKIYKDIQKKYPKSSEAYRANLQIKRLAKSK